MSNVVVAELGPLLTTEEAKRHLRITGSDDDEALGMWIEAATLAVLRYCNLAIVPIGAEAEFKAAAVIWLREAWRQAGAESGLRSETVDGAFSRTYTDVTSLNTMSQGAIGSLLNPHRRLRV